MLAGHLVDGQFGGQFGQPQAVGDRLDPARLAKGRVAGPHGVLLADLVWLPGAQVVDGGVALHDALSVAGCLVRAVGDCLSPRTVEEAILEGMQAGFGL